MQEVFLFLLGLSTGFVGTTTGGSSLITVPALISLGITPQSAVATARVSSFGILMAGIGPLHKAGKIDYSLALPSIAFAVLGSIGGAYLLLIVPTQWLQQAIGILTLFLTVLTFLKKKEVTANPISLFRKIMGWISFTFTGLIGGFCGAQGVLATYVFLLIFNKPLMDSIGTRKVTGLAVAVPALFLYGCNDLIHWVSGFAMITGSLIGSYLGTRHALKKGESWVQPLFTAISVILSLKLLLFSR